MLSYGGKFGPKVLWLILRFGDGQSNGILCGLKAEERAKGVKNEKVKGNKRKKIRVRD